MNKTKLIRCGTFHIKVSKYLKRLNFKKSIEYKNEEYD